MFKQIFTGLVLTLSFSSAMGGDDPVFMVPVSDQFLSTANDVIVIRNDGDSIVGDMKSITMMGAVIKNFSVKDASGAKHKFVPNDVKMLKWKLSKMAKMITIGSNAAKSINSAVNTDYTALYDMGYAVWEKVPDPENESNSFLLQVLNPTYCGLLRVYATPDVVISNMKKDELDDEYIVLKSGKSYLIEEGKFSKKHFAEIFGDCQELVDKYPQKKIDWDDLPKHVLEYTDLKK
jgi:hypothetical protein